MLLVLLSILAQNIAPMATLYGSLSFPTLPTARTHPISSSGHSPNQQTPPPTPSSVPPPSAQSQPLSTTSVDQQPPLPVKPIRSTTTRTKADSTDWISSSLTRRFGLGAGLAWVGFLAVGVVSEQIKTRLEVSEQESNTRDVEKEDEVVLPNGIRYYDIKVGGGATPRVGDLVVIDLKGEVEGSGEAFVNTFEGERRPLALVMGSRPYTRGMCEGIENVLKSMKAGGKRRVVIPPSLGFGVKGAELGSDVQIPPNATLDYIIQVDKVSIAPA